MTDLYVVDTNVYVGALRNRDELHELKQFLLRAGMRVRFDGIVAMELLAGAASPEHVDAVKALLSPYTARDWTIAPSFAACAEAGRMLAELAFGKRSGRRTIAPSLVNDAMLAASCRDAGAVLVTNNAADFTALQRHLRGFRFLAPWPIAIARSARR
jgi:predicted nucleic acid-binding protein